MNSGVYRIRNIFSDKQYVGSSSKIKIRWSEHKTDLLMNRHHSKYLQNAWNKYGEKNFIFEVLEYCDPVKEILLRVEQKHIDIKSEYNMRKIAESNLGCKVSEETKKKISMANTGKKRTPEFIKRMSDARIGKTLNAITKKKMSEFQRGRKHSEEQIRNRVRAISKPIYQIDKITLSIIAEFTSIKEAATLTNIQYKNISAVALGKRKTAGNYIWKYK